MTTTDWNAGRTTAGGRTGTVPGGLSRRAALGVFGAVLVAPVAACSTSTDGASGASTSTDSSSKEEQAIKVIAERVAAHWPHMSTMWPGLDYTKHNVIMFKVDEKGSAQRAWLINTSEHRELKPEEYASVPVPPYFLNTEFDGRPSIAVVLDLNHPLATQPSAENSFEQPDVPADPDPGVTFMYRLPTHELVHFYYQDSALQSAEGSRDTPYPVDPEPRIVRNMLHYRLNLAFTDTANRQDHLGRAKYWQDKWTSSHAQEADAIRTYDIREGVARYLERVGDYVDPSLTGEDLKQAQTAGLEYQYDTSIDGESYSLGFVSGLLLDETTPGWKDSFYASGKTLAETLLESVTAVEDQEDTTLRERITALITEENDRVKDEIDSIDQAETDTTTAYLRTEGSGSVNLSNDGTYSYKGKTVMISTTTELPVSGGGTVSVSGLTIMVSPATGEYIIPLSAGSYTYKDGTLTITGEKVSGEVKATESTENGRSVFTVTLASS